MNEETDYKWKWYNYLVMIIILTLIIIPIMDYGRYRIQKRTALLQGKNECEENGGEFLYFNPFGSGGSPLTFCQIGDDIYADLGNTDFTSIKVNFDWENPSHPWFWDELEK